MVDYQLSQRNEDLKKEVQRLDMHLQQLRINMAQLLKRNSEQESRIAILEMYLQKLIQQKQDPGKVSNARRRSSVYWGSTFSTQSAIDNFIET